MPNVTVHKDGMDKYGPPGIILGGPGQLTLNQLLQQEYNVTNGTFNVVQGLSSTGYALLSNGDGVQTWLSKTLTANYSRILFSMRFYDGLIGHNGIAFFDNATRQCYIKVETTGRISLYRGNGTLIASSGSSINLNTIHVLSGDITFSSTGAYTIYLDAVPILTGTGNTIVSANSYFNLYQVFGIESGGDGGMAIDDLQLMSGTDDTFCTDAIRIETQWPTGDYQTQFTNGGNLIVPAGIAAHAIYSTTNTQATIVGSLFLVRCISDVNCTLGSVFCVPLTTNSGAKFKSVVYSEVSSAPHTLLGTGTEVVGCVDGTPLSSTIVGGVALTAGTPYWIGFITDTQLNYALIDLTTKLAARAANTYSAGAPNPAPAMTTGQDEYEIWGDCSGTATNWESEAQRVAPDDTSSISSSTVGNEDLYTFPALTTTPIRVWGMDVRAVAHLDTGARGLALHVLSGVTDGTGSVADTGLATGAVWVSSSFDTDPNTGSSWTGSGVNAATAGPGIAS